MKHYQTKLFGTSGDYMDLDEMVYTLQSECVCSMCHVSGYVMSQQQATVRPLFHYAYRHEGVILDQQYNYQGNLLAACNSNGEILFYSAQTQEQNREPLYSSDRKRKNAAVLKIAWSLPVFGYFASASISREVDLYTCSKAAITEVICRRMDYIPLALAFCPIESEALLAVGLSDGSILILDEQLQTVGGVEGHEEAVNSLAWQHRILGFEKNKWIGTNFPHIRKPTGLDDPPLLVSGSSDATVKLWKWQGGKLMELYRLRAHQRAVREVQWRSTYLFDSDRFIITCSQDGTVSIWKLRGSVLQLKETRQFGGPVYKANFNFLGNMIAISYCNEQEERVETVIMKEKNGSLMGEDVKYSS